MTGILPNIIRFLHILVILFIIIVPFIDSIGLRVLHVSACITLLVHWTLGSDVCFLTLAESKLRGINSKETFIHQIVSPVYDIKEAALSRICYTSTVLLMFKSIYSLYNTPKFTRAIVDLYHLKDPSEQIKIILSI